MTTCWLAADSEVLSLHLSMSMLATQMNSYTITMFANQENL